MKKSKRKMPSWLVAELNQLEKAKIIFENLNKAFNDYEVSVISKKTAAELGVKEFGGQDLYCTNSNQRQYDKLCNAVPKFEKNMSKVLDMPSNAILVDMLNKLLQRWSS